MQPPLLLSVMGPTASGKTALAEQLGETLEAQLINADAFQVYRKLDIGTGKTPYKDRYELLDLVEPTEQFGLGEWIRQAQEKLIRLWDQKRSAILVGGTGLYIRALMDEYAEMHDRPSDELRQAVMDLEEKNGRLWMVEELRRLSPDNPGLANASNPLRVRRALERVLAASVPIAVNLPPYRKIKFALDPPIETLLKRIDSRLEEMLRRGWREEVSGLMELGIPEDAPGLKALGYRNLWQHLKGEKSLEAAVDEITIATRQYAKRQRTWLRSEKGLQALTWSEDLAAQVEETLELLN